MDINTVMTDSRQPFIERLAQTISEFHDDSQQQALTEFADLYFRRAALVEFQGRQYKDIYGFIAGWWQLISRFTGEQASIRVYNPNLDEHGWLSSNTVIQVHVKDMPFLTDSIRLELNRRHIRIHHLQSRVLQVVRDEPGNLVDVLERNEEGKALDNGEYLRKEALINFEISRHSDPSELAEIRKALVEILLDIRAVVDGYHPMGEMLEAACNDIAKAAANKHSNKSLIEESQAFLRWLGQGHYTFLGYSEFNLVEQSKGKGSVLQEAPESRQGLFKRVHQEKEPLNVSEFNLGMAVFYTGEDCIAFTKSKNRSRIHRSAYSDYVVVKKYDDSGNVTGERRFLGLYTSAVYDNKVAIIPLIRQKVEFVVDQTETDINTYDGKNLLRILETMPRDEMFQISKEQLLQLSTDVAQINERPQVRLFMRADPYGKFINCLLYVPRDIFSTRVRERIQNMITTEINAEECEFNTYFSESILARAHLVFKLKPEYNSDFDVRVLEQKTIDITRGWDENFYSSLVENLGEEEGIKVHRRYESAFSDAYRESYDARSAVADIAIMKDLSEEKPIAMGFYQPLNSKPNQIRFKIFHNREPLHLSRIVPVLENFSLKVLGEFPFDIEPDGLPVVWLHDFNLVFEGSIQVDVPSAKRVFQEAFEAIWLQQAENDAFNRLVLGARISWREVAILRSYARYMKQTEFNFGMEYIADTLAKHTDITRNLIALFKGKFDPRINQFTKQDVDRIERLQVKILDALDGVDNLNDDRIIRRYLDLLKGTLRTNYFQKEADGSIKDYISFKLAPRLIPDIPEPRPMYEIFVYSPRVEGVHLRGGAVARGGLRWSDRLQDYRTEVLGLVKAQQVKNAVIVPSGAKGGFVMKQPPKNANRNEFQTEGINCYRTFIRGLLDITDNIVGGDIKPPTDVVRHDGDDAYLVVAADKGTATFSDIANEISGQYDHWLGDAFASGGSNGYDHKGMGITARGAWVSVQHHFKEKGIDIQKEDFTVIGIGDMAGDVFGNGMLLSEHICLTAAFNHLSIFIDPNPDSAESFKERQRLFANPQLNWVDYNIKLISEGGGVFSRSAKSIQISPAMKARFDIQKDKLAPNDLINHLLKAPVDLIWNGGIGTYVKSSTESNSAVGDKANDGLRINGEDLRCKVFGEGGNLGVTQLGRVEFALHGGACNTDFIDNAAGVDCSDHEVNIKILIDKLVAEGDMTSKQRNKILVDMTESVSELVLHNNYQQTQAISVAADGCLSRFSEYRRLISQLEAQGRLDRKLEFIPEDEALLERYGHGKSLTRPELSVLISYVKVMLKELLANPDIAEDEYISTFVETAFPKLLRKDHKQQIYSHVLRKEIIATQLANDMVNNGGITFFHRLLESTGASATGIARAYVTARDVFSTAEFRTEIEKLDFKQTTEVQMLELNTLIRRVRRGTRWFLRNRRSNLSPAKEIPHFNAALAQLTKVMPEILEGEELVKWQQRYDEGKSMGFSDQYAGANALPSNLYSGLGIVEAASQSQAELKLVAHVFFYLSDRLSLNWFASQISEVSVENYWQAIAREAYLDDMEAQLRSLTVSFVRLKPEAMSLSDAFDSWSDQHHDLYERWCSMMVELQGSNATDFAMFSVAMRELSDLAQASSYCDSFSDDGSACRNNDQTGSEKS